VISVAFTAPLKTQSSKSVFMKLHSSIVPLCIQLCFQLLCRFRYVIVVSSLAKPKVNKVKVSAFVKVYETSTNQISRSHHEGILSY